MVDFKGKPFYLTDEDIRWVEETLAGMSTDEKVGQLFCPLGLTDNEYYLHHLINDLHIGGLMYRPGPKAEVRATHEKIQSFAKIPMLIAANTEAGGDGLCVEGTSFGKPLAVAATNDPEAAYHMGYTACAEGAAAGLNWSFAPIVDIDQEFHNPITNVRTFGSDRDRVIAMGSAYLRGAKEAGVAVSIKHFPGDGKDERDQHIVTSINSCSDEEWMNSYGKIYKTLIDEGAETVMVGHIALPSIVEALNPEASDKEKLYPATLSKELLTGLLRGRLGFNGMISTDATPMIGYMSVMPRKKALPTSIMAGCDMILFNKDLDEDWAWMREAVENGNLTMERLDEAVTRILALKAALKLPQKQKEGKLVPGEEALSVVGCEQHRAWAKDVADRAITLVRDTQNLLPISPEKYKRVYLNVIQKDMDPDSPVVTAWKALFEKEGFEVITRDRTVTIEPADFANPELPEKKKQMMHELYRPIREFHEDKDLYVYIANVVTGSNNTTTRLNWNVSFGLGDDAPWFVEEIPTMMISTCNPYHLFDAPMIKTYINAYFTDDSFNEAVMDKIMGRSPFKGVSPVDPYCGNPYIKMMG